MNGTTAKIAALSCVKLSHLHGADSFRSCETFTAVRDASLEAAMYRRRSHWRFHQAKSVKALIRRHCFGDGKMIYSATFVCQMTLLTSA